MEWNGDAGLKSINGVLSYCYVFRLLDAFGFVADPVIHGSG